MNSLVVVPAVEGVLTEAVRPMSAVQFDPTAARGVGLTTVAYWGQPSIFLAEFTVQGEGSGSFKQAPSFTVVGSTEGEALAQAQDVGRRGPILEWPKRQPPQLTSLTRKLIETMWAIVVSRAAQSDFPLSATKVTAFTNPESSLTKLILNTYTTANAVQTIAFWDSLALDFKDWETKLRDHERTALRRDLTLHFHWSDNGHIIQP